MNSNDWSWWKSSDSWASGIRSFEFVILAGLHRALDDRHCLTTYPKTGGFDC